MKNQTELAATVKKDPEPLTIEETPKVIVVEIGVGTEVIGKDAGNETNKIEMTDKNTGSEIIGKDAGIETDKIELIDKNTETEIMSLDDKSISTDAAQVEEKSV